MQIRRIALERFGRLDGQEFEFTTGLNLIKGANEAGKTTLREAILFALLGNPRHTTIEMQRDKRVDDRTAWGTDRRFRLALDIVDDGDVNYTLVKDWSTQSACLTNCQTGERTDDADHVQSELGRMVGCGSLRLFRSTVCVEQDAIEEVSAGRREIGDQLQSIVTGGADEATVSAVLSKLDDKIAEMMRGVRSHAPINPGPIRTVQDDIAGIGSRLADVRPQVERAESAARRMIELESCISASENELESKRSVRDLCNGRYALERQRSESEDEEGKLEREVEKVQEALREIEQADDALAASAALEEVDEEAERELARIHQRVIALQEAVQERSGELEKLRKRRPSGAQPKPVRAWPLVIVAAVGLVMFGTGIAVGATRSWATGVPIGLVGLALLAGSLAWLLIPMLRSGPSDIASRISFIESELRSEQDELGQATNRLNTRLSALECATYDDLVGKLADSRALERQRETAAVRRDAHLAGHSLEELIESRRTQSRLRRDAVEALGGPSMQRAAAYDALSYEALLRDIGEGERKLGALRTEAIECHTRISDAPYTIEDVYELEEQRNSLVTRLAHLQERVEVYRTTREAIQQAKDQTMRSARDELSPRIATYFERLTQGRYADVRADEDLQLQVFSHEKGDWVTPSGHELSRGTVDQLYLAVRLALLDLLYGEAKVPLLLDDPFVKFDADRRARAVALCKEVARDHQVLLFTCHGDYDEAADWVIELPAP